LDNPEPFSEFVERRLREHRRWQDDQEREMLEDCVKEIFAATEVPHEC
jgi:hypothetical protein